MKILVVVDMQNDFIDGTLGTSEAVKIVPAVAQKIAAFEGNVFFTRDTHQENYLDTAEGKKLPVSHCIQDTQGWQISSLLTPWCEETNILNKETFGSVVLAQTLKELHEAHEKIESITLVGLCTDICVISNALLCKAYLPEVSIVVDACCCAGVTPESHHNALLAMQMCQIDVENILMR